MYINNDDLDFLISLENKLGEKENWSDEVMTLWLLNERLIKQRDKNRDKTRKIISEKRKIDKNYARSKYNKKKGRHN